MHVQSYVNVTKHKIGLHCNSGGWGGDRIIKHSANNSTVSNYNIAPGDANNIM